MKIILTLLIISIFILSITYYNNFTKSNINDVKYENKVSTEKIGMANPAAVYCNELGYNYKIINTVEGQYGICIFPDGSQCDEWQFLEGKCGQKYSYCARQGYDLTVKSDGKDPFSKDYAVCVNKITKKQIGSVTHLFSLSEKATRGSISREQSSSSQEEVVPTQILSSSFDWRDAAYNGIRGDWTTPVKNQGNCGSCWAFSAVGTVEAAYDIDESDPNLDLDLSEQYFVSDCSDAGNCCGGYDLEALYLIRDNGIPDENCMTYIDMDCNCSAYCDSDNCDYSSGGNCSNTICSGRCADWQNRLKQIDHIILVPHFIEIIKQYLIVRGPLSVSMGIGQDFGGSWDGDIYRCTNDSGANHAVIITGYNDTGQYWIVKNSWGSDWNGDGYFKVGYGECGIEDYVYSVQIGKPDLIINYVVEPSGPTITYKIGNIGSSRAGYSHSGLWVDGILVGAADIVNPIPPGRAWGEYFSEYYFNCTKPHTYTVKVCADIYNEVDELNELNNCEERTGQKWTCPYNWGSGGGGGGSPLGRPLLR